VHFTFKPPSRLKTGEAAVSGGINNISSQQGP
jgi:hypothetical protein